MIFIHKTEPSIIKSLFLVTIRFCHHFTTLSSYHLPAKHHFLTHGLSWTVIGYPIINHFLTHGLSWTILDYHRLSQTIIDYHRLSQTIIDYQKLSYTIIDYHRHKHNGIYWKCNIFMGSHHKNIKTIVIFHLCMVLQSAINQVALEDVFVE